MNLIFSNLNKSLKYSNMQSEFLTSNKLQNFAMFQLKSLVFYIILQLTQIRYSESISMTSTVQYLSHYQDHGPSLKSNQILFDPVVMDGESLYIGTIPLQQQNRRKKRSPSQSTTNLSASKVPQKSVDACQSRMEVLTPYHATNSKGKLRTIVNSELMQQAIQVETCLRSTQSTGERQPSSLNRCNAQPDCGCEQKYKWHRLLVLDPNEDQAASKGLFMDWFLFPSNCVCRCKPGSSNRHFLRTISGSKKHNQSE